MAGYLNKVTLIGNLGADPQVRQLGHEGGEVVHLSIATSETWRDQATGERRQRTEWHRVVIFNDNLGKVARQYLKKGAKVYIEGTLQTRKWTDPQGIEKYTTEVVLPRFRGELIMLDGRDDAGNGTAGGNGPEEFDPETGEVPEPKKEAQKPAAPAEKKRSAGRSRR